jgi:hypothetical protein
MAKNFKESGNWIEAIISWAEMGDDDCRKNILVNANLFAALIAV